MKHIFKYLKFPVLFSALWAVFFFAGRYMLFIQEQTQFFRNDWHYILENMTRPSGLAQMISESVVQFYHIPWLGAIFASLVILWAVYAFKACLKRLAPSSPGFSPASLAPALILVYCLIVCEDTFPAVSFALTLSLTYLIIKVGGRNSWIAAALLSPAVYFLSGASAMLCPLIVGLHSVRQDGKGGVWKGILPVVVYAAFGGVAVVTELIGPLHTFVGYKYPMYKGEVVGAFNWYAISSWIAAFAAAVLVSVIDWRCHQEAKGRRIIYAGGIAVVAVAAALYLAPTKKYAQNLEYDRYNRWARVHYLYEKGDYQQILDIYEEDGPETSIESSYINLALYREGRLGDEFFKYKPRWMHKSLRPDWVKMAFPFAFIWVEVCDEMGALSKAQQSAFEGNMMASPRGSAPLVSYLAQMEIIRGNYKSAEKYIEDLEKTIFYRKWAKEQRQFLSDEGVAKNRHYFVKRNCLYNEDRTLFDMNDLWLMTEVAKNNRHHTSTVEYTGIMVLSALEIQTFVDFIIKMTEAGVLQMPLPRHFQEALVMTFVNNPTALQIYKIDSSLVTEYKNFLDAMNGKVKNQYSANATLKRNQDTFWYYFYSRVSQNKKQ